MNKDNKYTSIENGSINVNKVFDLIIYIICAICFLYYLYLTRHINRKVVHPIVAAVVLFTINLFLKRRKIIISKGLHFSMSAYILVSFIFGFEFGFYNIIPHYDKLLHFLSGILLMFVGHEIFTILTIGIERTKKIKRIDLFFSLFFAISAGAIWEIYEYIGDFFGFNLQGGSLNDTMQDIICGTFGAILTTMFMHKNLHK